MPKEKQPRWPTITERTVIVGRTGSGKTQMAVNILSKYPIDEIPFIIVDFKRDELINSIDKAQYIAFDNPLPSKPGIYILSVLPGDEEALSDFFRRVYERTDGSLKNAIGIYVDEGTMINPRDKYFNSLLTQGRSKKVPVIILSQRPVFLSVYAFTEASIYFVFDLTGKKDREKIAGDVPISPNYDLAEYHCYYYNVNDAVLKELSPAPDADTILSRIDDKLPRVRRVI